MDMNNIPVTDVTIAIDAAQGKGFLWIGFLVVLGLAAISATVLTYHWLAYDGQRLRHLPAQIAYYAGSVALLGLLLTLVATF